MADYYIAVDENRQAYLAHSFNKNHKFILKIGEGPKARYFYTKAQVEAYYNNLKSEHYDRKAEKEREKYKKAEKKQEEAHADMFITRDKQDALTSYLNKKATKQYNKYTEQKNKATKKELEYHNKSYEAKLKYKELNKLIKKYEKELSSIKIKDL